LEIELAVPPSPVATVLQYKYFPPQAVKLVAPKVRVFPVPIRVVGSEKELSPIHHSLLTELKELNVPGLHEMLRFPLKATDGIFEITGREILDGGGLWVTDKRRAIEPFELLADTVQMYSLAEEELFAATVTVAPVKPYGTPEPDQEYVTLVVFDDHLPVSQESAEPVLAVPKILGSTTTLGTARFCLLSLINKVGMPTLFISLT
jgi:hypothetical protein